MLAALPLYVPTPGVVCVFHAKSSELHTRAFANSLCVRTFMAAQHTNTAAGRAGANVGREALLSQIRRSVDAISGPDYVQVNELAAEAMIRYDLVVGANACYGCCVVAADVNTRSAHRDGLRAAEHAGALDREFVLVASTLGCVTDERQSQPRLVAFLRFASAAILRLPLGVFAGIPLILAASEASALYCGGDVAVAFDAAIGGLRERVRSLESELLEPANASCADAEMCRHYEALARACCGLEQTPWSSDGDRARTGRALESSEAFPDVVAGFVDGRIAAVYSEWLGVASASDTDTASSVASARLLLTMMGCWGRSGSPVIDVLATYLARVGSRDFAETIVRWASDAASYCVMDIRVASLPASSSSSASTSSSASSSSSSASGATASSSTASGTYNWPDRLDNDSEIESAPTFLWELRAENGRCYAFHGTSPDNVDSIIKGVDLRFAHTGKTGHNRINRAADFGSGLPQTWDGFYLADNPMFAGWWGAKGTANEVAVLRFDVTELVGDMQSGLMLYPPTADWASYVFHSRQGIASGQRAIASMASAHACLAILSSGDLKYVYGPCVRQVDLLQSQWKRAEVYANVAQLCVKKGGIPLLKYVDHKVYARSQLKQPLRWHCVHASEYNRSKARRGV